MPFPESLESLLDHKREKPIKAILKRGGSNIVNFDLSKIAEAIKKASIASGKNYDDTTSQFLAEKVLKKLESRGGIFHHSKRAIPQTEDVEDAVFEVFYEYNASLISEEISKQISVEKEKIFPIVFDVVKKFDPTGNFYEQYRNARAKVREKLVSLPFAISYDSTDKQLHIQNVKSSTTSVFNRDALISLILEKTPVNYNDAVSAIKGVEQVLAQRKSNTQISVEEITAIIDAKLLEKGYKPNDLLTGDRLGITVSDVEQLIFSKSNENSNIKSNNPEAVNLGIAELVLKEIALRKVYSEEVAEEHRKGNIHIHDLGYIDRVYCSAHSVEYIKKFGLDKVVANLDAKSSPAKSPMVLNNHIHTFFAAIQSSYAGALGLPMLNTLYGPALLKEVEYVTVDYKLKDDEGNIIQKKNEKIKKETLEHMLEDGIIKDFEIKETKKILKTLSRKEMHQIAQNLVFGASQSAFSRGGQTLFIDFNIDLAVPLHMRNVPALFLGGKYQRVIKNKDGEWEIVETTTKEPERISKKEGQTAYKSGDIIQPTDGTQFVTYGHELVRESAREFARALLKVAKEGDKYGNMFNFPKFDVHVSRETFEDPESNELLKEACDVVEHNDSVYFMYDRGDGMNVAQCCRLRERITDPELLKHPEKIRFCGFQNVTINLPRIGYEAKGNNLEEKIQYTFKELDRMMYIVLKAHAEKAKEIQKLLDTDGAPLRAMGKPSDDGEPYIDLKKATYIIGFAGLNELVQSLLGKEMHEDAEAFKLGLKILSHMHSVKNELAEKYKIKLVIEETPGESANRRLAKIDYLRYPEQAKKVLKGDIEKDEMYYTNSCHLSAKAPVSGLDRTILQSKTNPFVEAGAITHVFSGEKSNKSNAVYDFVKTIFYNTQSSQVVFSGEHTICQCCGTHMRGLKDSCIKCKNDDPQKLVQKTRIVGYFSDPRNWNKSKKGELKDRQAAQSYYAGELTSMKDLEAEVLESIIEPEKIRIGIVGSEGCKLCENLEKATKEYITTLPEEIKKKIEIVKYDVKTEEGKIMAAIYNAPIDTYPSLIVQKGRNFLRKTSEYPYGKMPMLIMKEDIKTMFEQIAKSYS